MQAPFRRVCELLLEECEQDPRETFGRYTALEDGGLKDPIRLHEKAIDDYGGRFDDGVLPEACVTDVLRARAIFTEARRFRRLAAVLAKGYRLELDGRTYRLELLRGKNKFKALDPTHFRCLLYNVWLSVEWVDEGGVPRRQRALCELQAHHLLVLKHNDASRAQEHYEFFRSYLRDSYEHGLGDQLDFMIERRMNVFDSLGSVPVLLSLLILCLRVQSHDAALGGGGGGVAAVVLLVAVSAAAEARDGEAARRHV